MSTAYIPTKEELEKLVSKQVRKTVLDTLPEAIREAKRKEWLTTDDVMDMLQCSRRHVQHLRDSGQIDFHQSNRTIRYHYKDIEAFLNDSKVSRGGK